MATQSINTEMLQLFTSELELCKVHQGEVVAVLSIAAERVDYAEAFLRAAQNLGATAFQVSVAGTLPRVAGVQGRHPLAGNQTAIDALKKADLVIDLMGLLFSAEQAEIQQAGTRILRVMEPLHILRQMFPNEDLRRRVDLARELLMGAKALKFTSPHGTNVRYRLGQYPVIAEYGYTDEPGRWDHFPSGFAFTQGNDGEIEGTVVLAPGDILCAFKRYVQSPVTLTIREGRIVDIQGTGLEAALIHDYIESFRDERGYAISHIGWGLNERANWYHMASTTQLASEHVMNALAFYGNVLFSTGPNVELGGSNDTPCHLDLPMRGCSLWLDDLQILDGGKVVHEGLRAPGW